jgi:hypothetical protein
MYTKIIRDATGMTDEHTLEQVEEIMRVKHPTLDHLTREELVDLAKTASQVYSKSAYLQSEAKELEEKAEKIPAHCRNALLTYIKTGKIPGHFLQAVISNDLKGAFSHADDVNTKSLGEYVNFIYNYAPAACWGSKEKMTEWSEKGGLLNL